MLKLFKDRRYRAASATKWLKSTGSWKHWNAHRWGGDRWAHGSVSTLEMVGRGEMLPCDYVTTIRPQKQICGAIPNTWAMWKTSCKEMIFSWCWIGHLPDSCNNGIEATRGKQLTDPWRCLAKSPLRIWLKKAGWKSHVWIVVVLLILDAQTHTGALCLEQMSPQW